MARVISSYMAGKILKKKASPAPDHLWISLRANINDLRNIEIEESLFDRSFIMHLLSGSWENDQVNFNNMMSAVLYNQFITNGD